jgi:hypothetical protein
VDVFARRRDTPPYPTAKYVLELMIGEQSQKTLRVSDHGRRMHKDTLVQVFSVLCEPRMIQPQSRMEQHGGIQYWVPARR